MFSPSDRYVPFVSATTSSDVLSSLITFLILFNNLVPISLYLTLEVVKFVQAKLVECDIRLFHAHTYADQVAHVGSTH